MPPEFIDVEIFAGAGGLAIGLYRAGFTDAFFYEVDAHSCETLAHNICSDSPTLSGVVQQFDVTGITNITWRSLNIPVRLLAGGSPCQPFSLGGKHLADQDGRNLFPQLFRAMRQLCPQAVLLENVRGLLRKSFKPYFDYILRQLECPSVKPRRGELWQDHDARIRQHQQSRGYRPEYIVKHKIIDAADFGVPQNRSRVFIVATRNDLPVYEFPNPTHSRSALARAQTSGDYWERHGIPRPDVIPSNGFLPYPDFGRVPWVTVRDALRGMPAPSETEAGSMMNHWRIPGARLYSGHMGSALDMPSKTIKAGVHGVGGGENTIVEDDGSARYYTLRETARIQTFPDEHFFTGARLHVTRQIGNAVPCLLAQALASPLYAILNGRQQVRAVGAL
jgi:DNA (cytosine-5)-methyltransferase 1